jgi:hypothetical protein
MHFTCIALFMNNCLGRLDVLKIHFTVQAMYFYNKGSTAPRPDLFIIIHYTYFYQVAILS